ncbi:MAG: FtsX-like permease family protein [Gammaproteobacteria bacterium]|nr:FtsX-like permease family protein [Gammaproteobacteria bacterium]
MSTARWVALRYLRTRKRQFAAFITWVSLVGLTLGVLVLTVVVSVMNGFDAELKTRILGTVPHLILLRKNTADEDVMRLADEPAVVQKFNFFLGAGMVTRNGRVNPVSIYGIDETGAVALAQIADNMTYGSLADVTGQQRGIVLGTALAAHLGLLPGDSVALVISEPSASGVRPKIHRYELVGTFEIGVELDASLVLIGMGSLGGNLDSFGTSGVRLTLTDPLDVAAVSARLAAANPEWEMQSWSDSYGELFQAVRLEKAMMFLILLMVVAVAAFNIISGQMMVVNDKRSDIAILRTMGASATTILKIFLLQGVVISSIGIAVGLLFGVVLANHIGAVIATMEGWFGIQVLDVYYFVEVPSLVRVNDLLIIALISWCLCLFSAWLPAHRAAMMNPVEGLHGA